MSNPIETQILEAEERLRLAMLNSDVKVLDELLAPELIFTNHLGQVLGKQDDLAAHQSGKFKIETLTPSARRIQLIENVAIVNVRVHLIGSYESNGFDNDLRFTRIWNLSSSSIWQIVAAHSSLVAV
ncbi:nuclear transport factor 2 family protein [Pleurocapsa sp. PCC 7319]|uniref:nuclear transport factor 2 family protein n=1 Tax=Pleurocapsa sp. PCC 7319 TaxID=118161 RepID=UPI00037161BE|nr:nuclear transport factor 2 family protein [Pleurocapsa sp. PCC 7319]